MSIKSVLMGFGLGIIFTAIIGIVFSKGESGLEYKAANKYDNSDIFVSSSKDEIEKEENEVKENKIMTLNIESGDTSKDVGLKLQELELVTKSIEFEEKILSMNKEKKIKIGIFKIRESENLYEIINKITN